MRVDIDSRGNVSMGSGGSIFGQPRPCQYCGAWHQGICPRIEEIEYHGNGTVRRVRLRPASPTQPKTEDPT